jgi:hypothetical protein
MHSFLLAASFGRSFLNACNHIAKRSGDLDRFRLSYESTGRGLAELSAVCGPWVAQSAGNTAQPSRASSPDLS